MPKLTLKQWRKIKDKSQDEVARGCGVSIPTLREWEKNPGKITLEKLIKMLQIYEISFDDVIFLPEDATNM